MKKTITALLLIASISIVGCSKLSHVDSEKFLQAADHINKLESANSYSYIGSSGGKAYIRHWSAISLMGNSTEEVIWVNISELPSETQAMLLAGQNPWLSRIYKLSEDEVMQIALEEISRQKIDLSKFGKPTISHPSERNYWFVMYYGLRQGPGHHFSIMVNDDTREPKLMRGM